MSSSSSGDTVRTTFIFSTFYFLVYIMVSVNIAFLPLHFRALGCAPWQIALLSAGSSLASLFASPLFGRKLSHLRSAEGLLLICVSAAAVAFAPLVVLSTFAAIAPCYLAYLIANSGVGVVLDTQALRRGLNGELSFERVRMWGSVGFVIASLVFGQAVEIWGTAFIAPAALASIVCCALVAYREHGILGAGGSPMPPPGGAPAVRLDPLKDLPRSVWVILAAVMLVWGSHGALYVYFSLYVRFLGWSGGELALAWNIGVCAEIVVFALYARIREMVQPRTLFVASVVATVVRWAILSMTESKSIILLSQMLHAFSFGMFYLSAVTILHEQLPDRYRSRGQAWLSAAGPGAGSLCGRTLFGWLAGDLASAADYQRLFFWAVGMAACGCIVAVNFRPGDAHRPAVAPAG